MYFMDVENSPYKCACALFQANADYIEGKNCEGSNEKELLQLKFQVEQFKGLFVQTSSEYCNSGVYTLKFHALVSLVEDLQACYSVCTGCITV